MTTSCPATPPGSARPSPREGALQPGKIPEDEHSLCMPRQIYLFAAPTQGRALPLWRFNGLTQLFQP